MSKTIRFICPNCGDGISKHNNLMCSYHFEVNDISLKYDYKKLLFQAYGDKFLLNQVLNNNAKVLYDMNPFDSLAMPGNNSKRNSFIETQIETYYGRKKQKIVLLDIGCGPLKIPEYLLGLQDKIILFGIDPLPNPNYAGFKIDGCAEFIPIEDNSFDYIVFGGSLDQTVSLNKVISEAVRVLKSNGRILIRLNDSGEAGTQNKILFRNWVHFFLSFIQKFNRSRFLVFNDYTVLYRPFGAVDPFHHKLISKSNLTKIIGIHGLIECSNEIIEGNRIIEYELIKPT